MQPGHHTHTEIHSQPEAWTATLAEVRGHANTIRAMFRPDEHASVVFTGCGSPYYLALAAAAQLQERRIASRGVPAAEIWLNSAAVLPPNQRALLVALSRSGETTEVLRAVETFRAAGRGDVLALTSYPDRPLGALADRTLSFPAGREQSLAQTRAFTTLLLAATGCGALWSRHDDLLDALAELPEVGRRVLAQAAQLAHELGHDGSIDRFYFLGSAARYGLACEIALKMKEMSLSHSEAFHFLEFRHGPKAMAGPGALVVGLLSESNRSYELAVLADMQALGARTVAVGEREADVAFASGLPESICGPLFLPFGQLLAYERALHNRQNPDLPHNLTAVVTLEG